MRADRATGALTAALLVAVASAAGAQNDSRARLEEGHRLWSQRLVRSAIAALEEATRTPGTAAEAWEALGRVYMFKGWQQEGVFPGWHDETEYRDKAIAAFKASLSADPSRAGAAEGLKEARTFADSPTIVPPAPPRPEVKALDSKIAAWRESQGSVPQLETLVAERAKLQADPAPYFAVAHMMLERRELARAADLATRGMAAADRFIEENEGAYKMSGKVQGARARSRAAGLDILGAVALQRMDFDKAAAHLEEAERLSRGQDAAVQVHLGDLAMARKELERAQDHFVNALSLAGAAGPLRDRATRALMNIRASLEDPAGFDAWLEEHVARRREERRAASLRSVLDRQVPSLALTGLDGRPFDAAGLRGKVLLLNFFSSW